jgi:hypothetical protein
MTREEKKLIRLQIISLLEQCQGCKFRSVTNAGIHVCPACPIGQQMQELGKKLDQSKTIFDGEKRRGWTEEEDFYLLHHYGIAPVERIAERLGRTPMAVIRRAYVLRKGGKIHAS